MLSPHIVDLRRPKVEKTQDHHERSNGNCAKFDANGNVTDNGAPCAGGSTVYAFLFGTSSSFCTAGTCTASTPLSPPVVLDAGITVTRVDVGQTLNGGVGALSGCTTSPCAPLPASALFQEATTPSQRQNENTIEGTVVSSSRDTLVVKTEDNQFQLFTFDRDTVKPRSLSAGTRVRVVSTPSDEAGVRLASTVVTLEAAPSAQGTAPAQAQPIPPAVRNLERDIKREARRWRLGVRAGAGLDPELLLFGVHSQMGPIFHRDVFFRPNAEFAFGEVTDLIALNLEPIYRVPISSRQGRWSPYIGAGPGFTFLHQSFQSKAGQGRNISFGNFDFAAGFNILTGVQFRRGTFFEVKTSLYSRPAPTLRLIFGYNF